MRKTNIVTLALIALVTAGVTFSHHASAITLIPPSLEFSANPGDSIKTKVKLFNETTTSVEMFSSSANFKAKDESGTPEFVVQQPPEDLASWFVMEPGPFVLQPGQRMEIPVEIRVPAAADPGGHFAGILFSPQDPTKTTAGDAQVSINSKIGTLVLVRVAGEVRETASISSFTVTGGNSMTHLPATFTLRVQNSGNVHVRPQGTILIKNLFGGQTDTLSINDANGAVLPNSVRSFDATWKRANDTVAKKGFFGEVSQQWSNFAFGPYTATATLNYGTTNKQSLVSSVKVTIIPWQLLTIELIVLVLIILIIVFGLKAYNKSIIRKAQQTTPPKKG